MIDSSHTHRLDSMTAIEKTVRTALASALIGQLLFLTGGMPWQAYLMGLGVYFATTAICGWDPLYLLLGRKGNSPPKIYPANHASATQDGTTLVDFKAANESRRERGTSHVA